MKVTPLKKQSKKNQRKFHAAKRGSWNGVSPITRVVQSKRIYGRKAVKVEIVDRIVQTAQNPINPTISFLVAQQQPAV